MNMKILPGHGSGGKLMNDMIDTVIRATLGPESIQLDDSAVLSIDCGRIVFTTDTFTVTPLFFPGGDIGSLAVNGTVNDLAVMGAVPKYLSCALVIEEGFDMEELVRVLSSMKRAADAAGVSIVTGDTKVVPRGNADRLFINTSGIGLLKNGPARSSIVPGDSIIINGFVGDHGIAVMAERNGLSFTRGLVSDCAPVNRLVEAVMERFAGDIRFMRDPTRGGVASVLNEMVKAMPFGARLSEADIPVRDEVRGACEILGIDPLYAANEGKVLMVAGHERAGEILAVMRATPWGRDAAIIGDITGEYPGKAYLRTAIGGERILPLLLDEQLPRIC